MLSSCRLEECPEHEGYIWRRGVRTSACGENQFSLYSKYCKYLPTPYFNMPEFEKHKVVKNGVKQLFERK